MVARVCIESTGARSGGVQPGAPAPVSGSRQYRRKGDRHEQTFDRDRCHGSGFRVARVCRQWRQRPAILYGQQSYNGQNNDQATGQSYNGQSYKGGTGQTYSQSTPWQNDQSRSGSAWQGGNNQWSTQNQGMNDQGTSTADLSRQIHQSLAQGGFTNIQIMPRSFVVHARDRDGNPVVMMISPNSVTALTSAPDQQNGATSQGWNGNNTDNGNRGAYNRNSGADNGSNGTITR